MQETTQTYICVQLRYQYNDDSPPFDETWLIIKS